MIGHTKAHASPPRFSPYFLTDSNIFTSGFARRSAQDALAGSVADLVLSLELPDEDASIADAIERLKLVQTSMITLQLSQEEAECHQLFATVLLRWLPLLDRADCEGTARSVISHLLGNIAVSSLQISWNFISSADVFIRPRR